MSIMRLKESGKICKVKRQRQQLIITSKVQWEDLGEKYQVLSKPEKEKLQY